MRIKQEVLDKLDARAVARIATKLDRGAQSVYVNILRNKVNGRLTKMDALTAISEETGLPIEELVEREAVQD